MLTKKKLGVFKQLHPTLRRWTTGVSILEKKFNNNTMKPSYNFSENNKVVLLESLNSVLSSFNVEDLIKVRAHYGHHKSCWHPAIKPFLYGTREDIHIIDLDQTIVQLKRSLTLLRTLAYNDVDILFTCARMEYDQLIRHACHKHNIFYVTRRWIPGTLTNSQTTIGRTERPGFMVIFSVEGNRVAIREAHQEFIPTLAIIDTNIDPRIVTYPIVSSDDSKEAIELYLKLMCQESRRGDLAKSIIPL
jgi:small subunit ribosomal protein S2